MAVVRCIEHPVQVDIIRKQDIYVRRAKPVGFPKTAVICGEKYCKNPGYLWLTLEEHEKFLNGERYFMLYTGLISVRVSDTLLELPEEYVVQINNALNIV
jgi:hypothetical protein